MESSERLYYLLQQVQERTASAAECDELLWLIDGDENGEAIRLITSYHLDYIRQHGAEQPTASIDWPAAAREILQVTKTRHIRGLTSHKWWWAAASIALVIGMASYFWMVGERKIPVPIVEKKVAIAPGKNGAILTLANGQQVVLDSLKNGVVATNASLSGGQLVYSRNGSARELTFNTLSTPKGRQFRVVLADGTIVWLNAASSIRYPVTSNKSERRVELIGEAYFEVARDRTRPFIVSSEGQEVRVLGTHFNINAYRDEPTTRTTLFEGSVEVGAIAGSARKLVPGQQAELTGKTITVKTADSEAALAWKNGDFIFNADIKEIMRQIARWYDVDVTYQGNISNQEFFGTFSRSKDIHEILSALELTKRVHFKVKERRIIVMP